jgi:hypothetical protein
MSAFDPNRPVALANCGPSRISQGPFWRSPQLPEEDWPIKLVDLADKADQADEHEHSSAAPFVIRRLITHETAIERAKSLEARSTRSVMCVTAQTAADKVRPND